MKYISTRGNSPALSFSEVLLTGLAPDGGLYLPESYPRVSDEELTELRKLSYSELALNIFRGVVTLFSVGTYRNRTSHYLQ